MTSRVPGFERDLILRVLTQLLREDVEGLRSRARVRSGWLAYRHLRLPVRPAVPSADLLLDLAVRAPYIVVARPGRRQVLRRLASVLRAFRPLASDADGWGAFETEGLAALTGACVRRRVRPRVLGCSRPLLRPGWEGNLEFEARAALVDHPVYPTSLAKVGLPAADLERFSPEHRPRFALRWVHLPAAAVERHGDLPAFWPSSGRGRIALPVHPAVHDDVLTATLADAGLAGLSDGSTLEVRPTLSLRTVAPLVSPQIHLKLPLPVRTLGRLNLRTIPRKGLADGVLLERMLRSLVTADPALADLVVADESTWLHAGHPLLAVLVRRWPLPDSDSSLIVPVAALPAPGPDGRPVFAWLASRFGGLDAFAEAYLRVLLGIQLRLWLRYGLVLEAHPQNVLLAVSSGDPPRIRVLVRDLDSARIDLAVAGASTEVPALDRLNDPRLASTSPGELADLFITTTLHQSVAAVLMDVARLVGRPARPWLAFVRQIIAEVARCHPQDRDTALLTNRILPATRLPVKRALTAATLLPKSRTLAADVNKFYGADAPSYL